MSTQAIIQAICEYPLISEVFHRYQYQSDFATFFASNAACMELMKREDAASSLLHRLTVLNPVIPNKHTQMYCRVLELLAMQPAVLGKLSTSDAKSLVSITLKNENERTGSRLEEKCPTYPEVAWILIGKVLVSTDYAPLVQCITSDDTLKTFIEGIRFLSYMGAYSASNIESRIRPYAESFINS
jgi:hypothetical protein